MFKGEDFVSVSVGNFCCSGAVYWFKSSAGFDFFSSVVLASSEVRLGLVGRILPTIGQF